MRPLSCILLSLHFRAIFFLNNLVILTGPWRWSSRLVFVSGMLINNTIDDASAQITYVPATSRHPSDVPCTECWNPSRDLAHLQTWHEGSHIIPTADADDISDTNTPTTKGTPPGPPSAPSPASHTDHWRDHDADVRGAAVDDDTDEDGNGRKQKAGAVATLRRDIYQPKETTVLHTRQQDSSDNPFFVPNFDNDDAGFTDQPVFAQFNFTGSAIYVYALIPVFAAPATSTPTFVNLTFSLNSQRDGRYRHAGTQLAPINPASAVPTAYQPNVLVYARSGIPEGFHSLRMDLGPDSVFLLDYITYSQDNGFANGGNSTENDVSSTSVGASPTSIPGGGPSASSASASTSTKSHNIATFAGAVGGSVGLLAILSISLAFSIYRRRTLARRRDRRLRETGGNAQTFRDSYHTDVSDDGPPMQGPAPFIPRYFPGTVPVAPPPYLPPVSPDSAEVTTPLLTSVSPVHTPLASTSWNTNRSGDTSYADRPPPTPPPEVEEDGYMAPPPSFSIAIASPVPAIFAQLSNVPAALASHSAAYLAQLRAQPFRRPSRTTLAEQGVPEDLPHPEQPPDSRPSAPISRSASTRASQSSFRHGQSGSMTPSSYPAEVTTESASSSSDRESIHISTRPPSSASEIPPSIPPPSEVIEAEREAREQRPPGQSVDDSLL